MLLILLVIVLVPLLVFTAYLYIQNRNLPELNSKVIPVVIVGIIGLAFTIWYSLKSEKIDLDFASTVYFHKSDLLTLDEHDTRHHLYGGDEFSGRLPGFIRDRIEHDERFDTKDLERRIEEAEELYSDMVFLKLIDRFFWAYADWWDVRIRSQRHGNGVTSIVSAIKPDPDCGSLTWEDFLSVSDSKDAFPSLLSSFPKQHWPTKMTVPPKTQASLTATRYGRSLVLRNPFVRVSITIFYRGGGVGIGDYAWFLGYDNKKSEEFWAEHLEVTCDAVFERTKSGHPEMMRHRRWVETMFGEIRYQLDDQKRMERAREYRDLISRSR